MKQLILSIFMMFALTTQAQKNVVQSTRDVAVEIIDSTISKTKQAGTVVAETANTIDTSRITKQIYSDFKAALVGIASALKVGVEHVYGVLVKQQVVKAIQWTILGLLPIICFIVFGKSIWRWSSENSDPNDLTYQNFLSACFFIICFVGIGFGIAHIDTIITGFVNPEYGAMTDIMEFVERIKATR